MLSHVCSNFELASNVNRILARVNLQHPKISKPEGPCVTDNDEYCRPDASCHFNNNNPQQAAGFFPPIFFNLLQVTSFSAPEPGRGIHVLAATQQWAGPCRTGHPLSRGLGDGGASGLPQPAGSPSGGGERPGRGREAAALRAGAAPANTSACTDTAPLVGLAAPPRGTGPGRRAPAERTLFPPPFPPLPPPPSRQPCPRRPLPPPSVPCPASARAAAEGSAFQPPHGACSQRPLAGPTAGRAGGVAGAAGAHARQARGAGGSGVGGWRGGRSPPRARRQVPAGLRAALPDPGCAVRLLCRRDALPPP